MIELPILGSLLTEPFSSFMVQTLIVSKHIPKFFHAKLHLLDKEEFG